MDRQYDPVINIIYSVVIKTNILNSPSRSLSIFIYVYWCRYFTCMSLSRTFFLYATKPSILHVCHKVESFSCMSQSRTFFLYVTKPNILHVCHKAEPFPVISLSRTFFLHFIKSNIFPLCH
jgi:hypothetical protein